jgi:predicted nucleic acid-binding protein
MIVVSDTTPIHYLVLIGATHLLPGIFGRVFTPSAVIGELLHPRAPEEVRIWANNLPGWLTIQDPTRTIPSKLGAGESAAISLALELKADRILIDDRDGSRIATRNGLNVAGTLAILEEAAKRGLIGIEEKLTELKKSNFRASEALYQAVVGRVREQGHAEGFR